MPGYNYDRRPKTAAVIWTEKADTYEVSGSYNELKDKLPKLKTQGWSFDGSRRIWWVRRDNLTPKKVENIKKVLGIQERNAPSQEDYEKILEVLKPFGRMYPGGLLLGPTGVDFRVYGVEWVSGSPFPHAGWFITPKVDSKHLGGDLSKVVQSIKDTQEKAREIADIPSDSVLRVTVSDGQVHLTGDGTFPIKDVLKEMHFRYENRTWSKSVTGVDVSRLKALVSQGRAQVALKQQEDAKVPTQERGRQPASPKQVDLLKRMVAKHHEDWFDITDGMGSDRPPSSAQIERMTSQEASAYIDMVINFERGRPRCSCKVSRARSLAVIKW